MTAALEGDEWSASRPGRTLPPGKTRYPFYRRLGVPQGRSGRTENLVPTGIRSRTVQPVVSRYTDWATRPTTMCSSALKLYKAVSKNSCIQIFLKMKLRACHAVNFTCRYSMCTLWMWLCTQSDSLFNIYYWQGVYICSLIFTVREDGHGQWRQHVGMRCI